MVTHGVVSLAAFLLIGLVELRCGTDAFRYLGGLANGRPVLSTVFLIAALFTLAVPGSTVFISELYILIGAFQFRPLIGAAAAWRSCWRRCTRCAGTRRSSTRTTGPMSRPDARPAAGRAGASPCR